MFRIDGIITSAAASHGTAPAVTFDLFTALVAGAAFVLAWLVYRWTAPSPEASVQASRGERLAYAIGAAASVIVVGAFLVGGVRAFEYTGTGTRELSPDSRSAAHMTQPVVDGPPAGHGP
ncbi:hypothetical protein ABZ741_21495 [Streptomyces globisporus]|uniref:hypothetical protein n=1 Tax=Streptomyces globisporus TaxID=1908 RepID=UPI003460A7F5